MILDMATSAAPEGKVRALLAARQPVPQGWVITSEGLPTTDPADLYGPPRGALLPFGGHKGFGLAVMIDALAGGLSGASCCHLADAPMEGKTDGVLLLALSVEAFLPLSLFVERVRDMIRHVKSSPPGTGLSEVVVPGEIEAARKARTRQEGIPIADALWQELMAISSRLGAGPG